MDVKPVEIHKLQPLFEDVQRSDLFADSKTFPDCLPKINSDEILKYYLAGKDKAGFNLADFIYQYFDLPDVHVSSYQSDLTLSPKQHIERLWPFLTRQPEDNSSSLITLPYPYIVPGGRFGEIYYWDSYFTMLGLQESGQVELIQCMIDNFSFLIDEIGYVPNGNRTYYLGRSQPPFFSLMVELLCKIKGEVILIKYLPQLEKEYSFWMQGKQIVSATTAAHAHVVRMPDGAILNRYWDENCSPRPEAFKEDVELAHHSEEPQKVFRHIRAAAESGWDFSCRWFRNQDSFETICTTDIVPVDLNCLLLFHEELLSKAFRNADQKEKSLHYKNLAIERKKAIQKYCWNENNSFYFDYNFVNKENTASWNLAAAFPLFFKLATQDQADKVCSHLENKFLKPGGLTTTLVQTGQQWDAPNGWAPLQWITYKGCSNYNKRALASLIRSNWMKTNERVYEKTGKMMEKYNVLGSGEAGGGGEYPNQDGFGWTNGVYLAMAAREDPASF